MFILVCWGEVRTRLSRMTSRLEWLAYCGAGKWPALLLRRPGEGRGGGQCQAFVGHISTVSTYTQH